MTTRTGIPTAATYVFVNMINKLRADFKPEYLAAVYDVGAPLLRDELAMQMKGVQKFNIKTQQFETIEYGGYKANRKETPPDPAAAVYPARAGGVSDSDFVLRRVRGG